MGKASDSFWTGAKLIAALSLLAYTYSYGYLFRIYPGFIPAFSPLDLILWATTALWPAVRVSIFLSVILLPLVALLNKSSRTESRYRRAKRLSGYEPYLSIALIVVPTLAIAAVMAALEGFGPRQPLMARLYIFVTPLMFLLLVAYMRAGSLWRIRPGFLRPFCVALLLLLAFLIGDLHAFRVSNFPTGDDMRLCPALAGTTCEPLIFLGSEAVISRRSGEFVLQQKEDGDEIRSSGASDYLPEHLGPTPNLRASSSRAQ